MILKSDRVRTRGGGVRRLLDHLLRGAENEAVIVLRGTEQDVLDAFTDARRMAREFAVRHWIISPGQAVSTEEMLGAVDALGREFGFDPATAMVVEHRKARVDLTLFDRHLHALVPEADVGTGKVLASAHSFARQEKVARLCEHGWGHPLVQGPHHRAVLAALRREARDDVADALDAAFPEPIIKPREAYTCASHQRAKREGLDLPAAREAVAGAWQTTRTRAAFEVALAERKLRVSRGEKPGTFIVTAGDLLVGSLARLTRSRKGDVLARMENTNDEQFTKGVQPAPSANPQVGRGRPSSATTHHGASDLPEHSRHPDPAGADCADGPGRAGPVHRQPDGYDTGNPPRHLGGSSPHPGEPGGASRPTARTKSRESSERGHESLTRTTGDVAHLTLALDRPDRTNTVHELLAEANRLAQCDLDQASGDLSFTIENARFAQVMAKSDLEKPPSLKAARAKEAEASRAAILCRADVKAAARRYLEGCDAPPRSWWRRVLGWVTGENKKQLAAVAALAATADRARSVASIAEAGHRQARNAFEIEEKRHEERSRCHRAEWERLAKLAPARIAAANAGLALLGQRPDLARMGAAGLSNLVTEIAKAGQQRDDAKRCRQIGRELPTPRF